MGGLTQGLLAIAIIIAGALAGWIVYRVTPLLLRATRLGLPGALDPFLRRSHGAVRLLLPLLGAYATLPIALEGVLLDRMRLGFSVALIMASAYVLIRFLYGAEDFLSGRLGLTGPDNLDARRMQTQLRVLRSILVSFIVFATVVVLLLFLPGFRQIGAGLLASAGVAGIVLGFAAQRALGNLLAGFQIAITQPIRLDDVVVVEGEWGRIEEITLTYVVVGIWDQRRLILPISYFLEHPFTNWTRESAEILGTVYLYTDYRVPVDELRAELDRILKDSPYWDGRASGLLVTDSKENTLELRALASAKDGSDAWNLRCLVREKLITFLQTKHPEALPRVRAEIAHEGTA